MPQRLRALRTTAWAAVPGTTRPRPPPSRRRCPRRWSSQP